MGCDNWYSELFDPRRRIGLGDGKVGLSHKIPGRSSGPRWRCGWLLPSSAAPEAASSAAVICSATDRASPAVAHGPLVGVKSQRRDSIGVVDSGDLGARLQRNPFLSIPTASSVSSVEGTTELQSADKLFDGIPGHPAMTTSHVLDVTVTRVLYPVTEKVLGQVFDPYGVNEICVVQHTAHVKAFVEFQSWGEAAKARGALHGRCIYDDCCCLNIQYAPPSAIVIAPTPSIILNGNSSSPTTYVGLVEAYQPAPMLVVTHTMSSSPLALSSFGGPDIGDTLVVPKFFDAMPVCVSNESESKPRDTNEQQNLEDGTQMTDPFDAGYDEVLTHVGGVPLFIEIFLEPAKSAEEVLMDEELADTVLTHVGEWSLFIEHDMVTCHEFQGNLYAANLPNHRVCLPRLLPSTRCTRNNNRSTPACGPNSSFSSHIISEVVVKMSTCQSLIQFAHNPSAQLVRAQQAAPFLHVEQFFACRLNALYVQWDPGIMKLLMLAIFWKKLQRILGPEFCPRTSKDDPSVDWITLSPCVERAKVVLSKSHLMELDDELFTYVGGMSLFQEEGLGSADEVFDAVLAEDVYVPYEVLTHVDGLSLFLEFGRDRSVASANEVWHDKSPWFGSTFSLGDIATVIRMQEIWVCQLALNDDSVYIMKILDELHASSWLTGSTEHVHIVVSLFLRGISFSLHILDSSLETVTNSAARPWDPGIFQVGFLANLQLLDCYWVPYILFLLYHGSGLVHIMGLALAYMD